MSQSSGVALMRWRRARGLQSPVGSHPNDRGGRMADQERRGDFASGERTTPEGPPRDFGEGEEEQVPGPPHDFAEGAEREPPGPARDFGEGEEEPREGDQP